MFGFLKQASQKRTAWFLLLLTITGLQLTALYFQYVMNLQPCVLCIYQRTALYGVMFAALLGWLLPSNFFVRWLAIAGWIYGSIRGLQVAWEHVQLQLNPSPFARCDFIPQFPNWAKLDIWMPKLFSASGNCADKQWSFLGLEMSQWMIVVFSLYLLVGVIVLLSQFVPGKKKQQMFSFHKK